MPKKYNNLLLIFSVLGILPWATFELYAHFIFSHSIGAQNAVLIFEGPLGGLYGFLSIGSLICLLAGLALSLWMYAKAEHHSKYMYFVSFMVTSVCVISLLQFIAVLNY
jgi:hypothetical protein